MSRREDSKRNVRESLNDMYKTSLSRDPAVIAMKSQNIIDKELVYLFADLVDEVEGLRMDIKDLNRSLGRHVE